MTTTARQNNLILNQDWTRIYQTFQNADFKSYDFENIRRVIITYFRENYPEDFNDYIESSEYLALIDAIAFLGQSLSFRIDLASRENFLELADRKESVLRLARMLSYNPKRNIASSGLLKFTSVSTTEPLRDSNGRNLSERIISWNDPTNSDWLEQFLLVINAILIPDTEFGRSSGKKTIQGIPTEQYRIDSTSTDVPIFAFSKSVANQIMEFEIVSTVFNNAETIYEEDPTPGAKVGFVYRQDGRGPSSANNGFFMLFKQGSLELADFSVEVPTTNERISINAIDINNDDIWLYSLDENNAQIDIWTKVSELTGNNIAYNSIDRDIRNIYSVITKEDDAIDLLFADGVYGNLPQGSFRVYYRTSNGLNYTIFPSDMRGINLSIPYRSKSGSVETLTITLGLNYNVNNSAATESIDQIKQNAPAIFYTQNRMVTAEDYNLAPLSSSQNILKVRSINRISSGISRNFDIIDATGKYSNINLFADDGYVYKQDSEKEIFARFNNRVEVLNFLKNEIEPLLSNTEIYNFYFTKFDRIFFTDVNTVWQNVSSAINKSTGYFKNIIDNSVLRVGRFSTSSLKYLSIGALVKFVPPEGSHFMPNGTIMAGPPDHPGATTYLWSKVVSIYSDGAALNGILPSGEGTIMFNDVIPTDPNGLLFPIASRIVPRFVRDLSDAFELEIANQIIENQNFGIRYDQTTSQWKIILAPNINLTGSFNLGKAGDTTRSSLDSSWLVAFVKKADRYQVRTRGLSYIFGSVLQNRFYLDANKKVYDSKTGIVQKDQVTVLGINSAADSSAALRQDVTFNPNDTIKFSDGYESNSEVKIAFSDVDDDGVIDDPESFEKIVGQDVDLRFLFFREFIDAAGSTGYEYVDNSNDDILIRQRESLIDINDNEYTDGTLIYFYDNTEDVIKRVVQRGNSKVLVLESSYRANIGRANLKFQYTHIADSNSRIDPSSTNIIDVFLLERNYDASYRAWISGDIANRPEPPSSDILRIEYGSKLNAIKTISDEIIYHPVRYKVLFGRTAEESLRGIFRIVKNPEKNINDNDLKVRTVAALNEFFDVNNWDFGDRFYLSELISYIINSTTPDISNIDLVPVSLSDNQRKLYEIQSRSDEIFINGATVDDIEIVSAITAADVRVDPNRIINNTSTIGSTSTTGSTSTRSSIISSGGSVYTPPSLPSSSSSSGGSSSSSSSSSSSGGSSSSSGGSSGSVYTPPSPPSGGSSGY